MSPSGVNRLPPRSGLTLTLEVTAAGDTGTNANRLSSDYMRYLVIGRESRVGIGGGGTAGGADDANFEFKEPDLVFQKVY